MLPWAWLWLTVSRVVSRLDYWHIFIYKPPAGNFSVPSELGLDVVTGLTSPGSCSEQRNVDVENNLARAAGFLRLSI